MASVQERGVSESLWIYVLIVGHVFEIKFFARCCVLAGVGWLSGSWVTVCSCSPAFDLFSQYSSRYLTLKRRWHRPSPIGCCEFRTWRQACF